MIAKRWDGAKFGLQLKKGFGVILHPLNELFIADNAKASVKQKLSGVNVAVEISFLNQGIHNAFLVVILRFVVWIQHQANANATKGADKQKDNKK